MSQPTQVDPRGLRVAAGITAVVLALVLITPEPVSLVLLAVQVAVFAIAALVGLKSSPYSLLFATVIRPRIGAPAELEDSRPPRFAQVVGLVFTTIALVAFIAGAAAVGYIATAFALVAALLNASIGLCLGCELYLVLRRLSPASA
jgi:small-conductance mechanosensitive channel